MYCGISSSRPYSYADPYTTGLYVNTLETIYSNTDSELNPEIEQPNVNPDVNINEKVLLNPGDQLQNKVGKIANYSTYFHRLFEEICDLLDDNRSILKGRIAAAPTKLQRVTETLVSIAGVFTPLAELIGVKLPHNLPHIIETIKEGAETGHHLSHLLHDTSEKKYKIANELRGEQLYTFIREIAEELTYRYRYELSILTTEKCSGVAFNHFLLIKDYLLKIGKVSESADIIRNNILSITDPDPKKLIETYISDYLHNREDRLLRSYESNKRQNFLTDVLRKLENRAFTSELISTLSSKIAFKNRMQFLEPNAPQTLENENVNFSLSSPYIRRLSAANPIAPLQGEDRATLQIKNGFWTVHLGTHITMKDTCRKILLVLIRQLTVQNMNKPENSVISSQIKEQIQSISSIHQLQNELKKIEKNINQNKEEMQNQIYQLRGVLDSLRLQTTTELTRAKEEQQSQIYQLRESIESLKSQTTTERETLMMQIDVLANRLKKQIIESENFKRDQEELNNTILNEMFEMKNELNIINKNQSSTAIDHQQHMKKDSKTVKLAAHKEELNKLKSSGSLQQEEYNKATEEFNQLIETVKSLKPIRQSGSSYF